MRARFAFHLLAAALVLAAAAAILAAMGQPWWCRAGDLSLGSWDVWSRHNSQHLLDPYTFTHVLHGVALYGVGWVLLGRYDASPATRAWLAFGFETAWEILENTDAMIQRYRTVTISLDYHGDSVVNSIGDVLACMAGYLGASVLPVWVSAVGFFVIDGLLLLWIRDSLALNVLMLVHPIDAVRT